MTTNETPTPPQPTTRTTNNGDHGHGEGCYSATDLRGWRGPLVYAYAAGAILGLVVGYMLGAVAS